MPTLTTILLSTLLPPFLVLLTLHRTLRARVTSRSVPFPNSDIKTLPPDLQANPSTYRIRHYIDAVPLSLPLSEEAGELFTALLRRNMRLFSTYLPQAYLMRLLARTEAQRLSFEPEWIAGCRFAEGDVVCGFYQVLHRSTLRCEMGMGAAATEALPASFGGRLVISLVPGEVLETQTLQWVARAEVEGEAAMRWKGFRLPLERRVMRWLHEVASWWLLVGGARWVSEEVKRRRAERERVGKRAAN